MTVGIVVWVISVAEGNLPRPRIGCGIFTVYHARGLSDTLSTFSCLITENPNHQKYVFTLNIDYPLLFIPVTYLI